MMEFQTQLRVLPVGEVAGRQLACRVGESREAGNLEAELALDWRLKVVRKVMLEVCTVMRMMRDPRRE
jgi:hypothetical protein